MSSLIIIPQPNKAIYNFLKIFWLIILLNTLGKHIEKIISDKLQNQSITSNFIHPNQIDGLKHHSTTNVDIFFINLIYLE